jgi:hypothetical protein
MIKKILTMSVGVVLGSMITTASFAAASADCLDARDNHFMCLDATINCRDVLRPAGDCDVLRALRYCKKLSMRLTLAVCHEGTYDAPANAYEDIGSDHPHAFPYPKNHDYDYDLHYMFGPEDFTLPADAPDGIGDCMRLCTKYSPDE